MHRIISRTSLAKLFEQLDKTYRVYVPTGNGGGLSHAVFRPHVVDWDMGGARTVDPLKAFFFQSRVVVDAESFGSPSDDLRPLCIVGVKACDLKGFAVQDRVFADTPPADPFYTHVRDSALIIASDCTAALETCFCTAMGIHPFPEQNHDLSLSPIADGFVAEAGSERGRAMMEKHGDLFDEAPGAALAERDRLRDEMTAKIRASAAEFGVPSEAELEGAVARNTESAVWAEEAENCVECGACNTVCPTCHCFFLCDQEQNGASSRLRLWDSCLYRDFARVAGGGNPRDRLWMRLRNRFEKKFDYFPRVAGFNACTGCGRCIAACPARIDIRRVLKRLTEDASEREPLSAYPDGSA